MKQLTIRLYSYNRKRPPVQIRIQPGTTTAHVLAFLKLPGYVLVPAGADDLAAAILQDRPKAEDDLYARFQDGDTLIALPAFEAARIAYAAMMRKHAPKETTP